ncbi:hypothetical protein BUALT_Bualt11G0058200 [Buddleja alternifolia]|uniref:Uncharacterized protein n=1 Tax=Buddleja alternifolia TaxID=168488 RepID=A0AAV6X034_9LAMI|nr:hypothetical protein BUALT_Bualt11G0058200 [Buddleja alternifolia]
MESIPLFNGSLLKRRWRRRGYNRLSPTNKRNVKIVRFGTAGNSSKRSWRLKLAPKLRLVRLAMSPLKLWYKFKNSYMKMMLRLANTSGTSNSGNIFGAKRIPKARDVPIAYSRTEFEDRSSISTRSRVSAAEFPTTTDTASLASEHSSFRAFVQM